MGVVLQKWLVRHLETPDGQERSVSAESELVRRISMLKGCVGQSLRLVREQKEFMCWWVSGRLWCGRWRLGMDVVVGPAYHWGAPSKWGYKAAGGAFPSQAPAVFM